MAKKPKLWFDTIGGDGPLSITFIPDYGKPYGVAIEDLTLNGVGYFTPDGELIEAEFDHVDAKNDHQILKFDNKFKNQVEVTVKNGKVDFKISSWKSPHKNAAKAA